MSFKFVANISRLFSHLEFIERFKAAKDAGFSFVEITTPLCELKYTPEELSTAVDKSGVQVALINACTGSFSKKEFGLMALSDAEVLDRDLNLSLKYVKALKAERVHLMAGVMNPNTDYDSMELHYINNLKRITSEFMSIGVTCQIEFICHQTLPNYFLSSGKQALKILKEVQHPNLHLQLDIFHLQMTEGNLTEAIKNYLPYTSYIQVSQAPGRNEPNSAGEIDYKYIFDLLRKLKFDGYIGLEYSPSADTFSSFSWMQEWSL